MSTTLITGASGFIGQYLAGVLRARGKRVTCLVRTTSKTDRLAELGCQLVFGDVAEPDSLPGALREAQPDSIYHLAGLTKAQRRHQLFAVNDRGTRNLLAAASQLDEPPTIVVVSTLASSGPARNGTAKSETDTVAPVSYYGKSKLAGEQAAAEFADRMPISLVRPPIVLGPHDADGLELFKSIANFGVHPVPSRTSMSVSWIHADDLARALLSVMDKGQRLAVQTPSQGVYFAASHEIIDYAELGRMIGRALGKPKVRVLHTPAFMVWAIAAMNETVSLVNGRPNIMNFDKAREATAGSWTCSCEKLAQETGFTCQLSLEDTLASCVRWYREAGWLS